MVGNNTSIYNLIDPYIIWMYKSIYNTSIYNTSIYNLKVQYQEPSLHATIQKTTKTLTVRHTSQSPRRINESDLKKRYESKSPTKDIKWRESRFDRYRFKSPSIKEQSAEGKECHYCKKIRTFCARLLKKGK
jgi:hypothetical protein